MIEAAFRYSIAVSVTLVIAWPSYRTTLGNDRRFGLDRAIVLCLYAAALLMLPSTMLLPVPKAVFVFGKTGAHTVPSVINLTTLSIIWAVGVAVTSLLTVVEMSRIALIIAKARKETVGHRRVYVTSSRRVAPFSIGNAIVMNDADFSASCSRTIAHELGHVTHLHTIDLILVQSVAIFCWYNPAAWLFRRDLKNIHEFQADAYVLASGFDARDYQLFLIGRAAGMKWPGITNRLNSCDLGKRLNMMNTPDKRNRFHLLRYAAPAIGLSLAFAALCIPAIRTAVIPVRTVSNDSRRIERRLDLDIYVYGNQYPEEKINDIPVDRIKSITINKNDNRMEIETR